MGLTSIETPNATTIVFHLQKPFADFDYVAALPQTVPVPPAKDTGANYQLHPVSTGPYKFQSYQLDKQFTLVRNPHWSAATDPHRKQLASTFVFNLNVNADSIDNNLIHNFAEQNDPVVNNLFVKAVATTDPDARNQIWAQIDRRTMQNAVILPGVYARSLLYRNPNLTNVYVSRYYAMYDYANVGMK